MELPDLELLTRCDELCNCGSGEKRAMCCHWGATFERGAVLWPM